MSEPFVPLEFESEYVVGTYGTVYPTIEVFSTGEMQGAHNERLRIIKLLEEDGYMIESDKNHAIALIKGGQK